MCLFVKVVRCIHPLAELIQESFLDFVCLCQRVGGLIEKGQFKTNFRNLSLNRTCRLREVKDCELFVVDDNVK